MLSHIKAEGEPFPNRLGMLNHDIKICRQSAFFPEHYVRDRIADVDNFNSANSARTAIGQS